MGYELEALGVHLGAGGGTASVTWNPKGAEKFTDGLSFISVWTKKSLAQMQMVFGV